MSDPVTALGDRLRTCGYDADAFTTALDGLELTRARLLGPTLRLFAEDPLATLIELFYVLRPMPRERAAAALGPVSVDGLVDAGLVTVEGELVVGTFQISHWFGDSVLHDPLVGLSPPRDYVAGGTISAETLMRSTIRLPLPRALDLGTGSGVQALTAARHCAEVVAVDVNPHAVELARLNTRLNGANIEVREGSWFEPVEGELFDLIVANPPYVLSPDTELLFRDGDRKHEGDLHAVIREVVHGVARHLGTGGIGHVLCDWGVRAGEERYAALRELTAGLGCNVCIVDFGSQKPTRYAARWNDSLATTDPGAFEEAVARWLAYFAEHDLETVRFGLVVLQRGFSDEPWFHTVEAAGVPQGAGGRQLLRILEAQDYLHGSALMPPELARERFVLAEGHSVTERNVYRDGEYVSDKPAIAITDGLGTLLTADPLTVQLLLALDGGRPLDQTLDELAAELGIDQDALREFGLMTAQILFELGLLLRV